jgi:hypothetical protein
MENYLTDRQMFAGFYRFEKFLKPTGLRFETGRTGPVRKF